MPYYEYVIIRDILAKELKDQAKDAQQQKQQQKSAYKPSMNTPKVPKFKK